MAYAYTINDVNMFIVFFFSRRSSGILERIRRGCFQRREKKTKRINY